jgi:Spy/CpxP family protein refolding chaperone
MSRSMLVRMSLVLGLGLVVGVAWAQPGDAPSGERGQRTRRGMGPGMFPGGGLMLLRLEQVQKELNLSDEQKQKIKELRPGRPSDGQRPSPEEMQTRMEQMRKKVAEILKPEQLARLKQIELQVQGAAALGNPEIVKTLAITDDQRAKLKTIGDEAGEKARKIFGSMRDLSPEERDAKRTENQGKMREIAKDAMEKSLAVLTPEQREKFEKMKGKKIDIDFSALRRRPERSAPKQVD